MIRNAEALGDKYVSHDAAKKVSFQSHFKSCQGVRGDDIVRQWVRNDRCSDRESTNCKNCWSLNFERPASLRGLTAVSERGRVVRALTEGTLVSMSILPFSQSMWAERSGAERQNFLLIAQLHLRESPSPLCSRFDDLPLPLRSLSTWFFEPHSPLIWLFDPLRSCPAARPDLKGKVKASGLLFNRVPLTRIFISFVAGRYICVILSFV